MFLNDEDIKEYIRQKRIYVEPSPNGGNIGQASIKLHLSPEITKYRAGGVADLDKVHLIQYENLLLPRKGYVMHPSEFILGSTIEVVGMPNTLLGWIDSRGSIARIGLQVHLCDSHIDPGFKGQITLQLKNCSNHNIVIRAGMYIAKIYFSRLSGGSATPYSGQYQGQHGPTVPGLKKQVRKSKLESLREQ